MKVVKGSVEMKLAAIFVFFAVALLLGAGVSSRLNIISMEPGVSVAQADDPTSTVVVNNAIINETPVTDDLVQ